VSCYNHDGTAYVNSFNNPGVTADLPSNAIPDSALTQDLVAWYRFEDGDARDYTAGDSTFGDSENYSGTVNGASYLSNGGVTDFESGANSGAFDFDGSSDYITTGYNKDKDDFTYCAWVNADSVSGTNDIIDSLDNTSAYWARIEFDSGEVSFVTDVNSNRVDLKGSNVSTGEWYHVAGVRSSNGDMELYLDGSLDATDSNNSDTIPHTNNERIGGRADDGSLENFNGRIDDVRIYNRALTASEISDIYNATKP